MNEVALQPDGDASPNRELPKRWSCNPLREWENEEWLRAELPNRAFSKFDSPRFLSKKDVCLLLFCPEDRSWPDQFLDDEAALGGRFGLKEDADLVELANEGRSCPDQPFEAGVALGGLFELKEDVDRDAPAQEDCRWPDQLLEADAGAGGRFEPKFLLPAYVLVAIVRALELLILRPAVLFMLRVPPEPVDRPPKYAVLLLARVANPVDLLDEPALICRGAEDRPPGKLLLLEWPPPPQWNPPSPP